MVRSESRFTSVLQLLMNILRKAQTLTNYRKYNIYIYIRLGQNFQIQNKLLCLPAFVTERIFKTHQQFCFVCFHSR